MDNETRMDSVRGMSSIVFTRHLGEKYWTPGTMLPLKKRSDADRYLTFGLNSIGDMGNPIFGLGAGRVQDVTELSGVVRASQRLRQRLLVESRILSLSFYLTTAPK